jgi:hypothetical protein
VPTFASPTNTVSTETFCNVSLRAGVPIDGGHRANVQLRRSGGAERFAGAAVSGTGLRPFTLTRWTNRIGGANTFFQDILNAHGLQPSEVLVVEDNPDSEIEAGNRLGMKTIQVLRSGVPPSDRATRQIRGLMELKELL